MTEICDILFKANAPTIKKMFARICEEYETNPEYKLKKIYEGMKLVGFWVYRDEPDGFRNLTECHYLGSNPYMALRMFREMMRGADRFRITVQKANERMVELYLRHGFVVKCEDFNNYILER